MKIKIHDFPGVIELTPLCFKDERGFFCVTYDQKSCDDLKIPHFVQDNESFSVAGTLRGLHFQKPPHAQGKLVRVLKGKVQDVIVDLRQGSPTFKKWKSFYLDSEQRNMLYVPEGFAHGFLALEDTTFAYKCTRLYNKESESGVRWNDPTLNISWDCRKWLRSPVVSEKDQKQPNLDDSLEELSALSEHAETCTYNNNSGWGHLCFCGADQFTYQVSGAF